MITLWQGSANTWDCDEMGHMNVRVYVEKAMEGLGALAHQLGMGGAFRTNGTSTLIPLDQHIRFIREVLPGRPLSMVGCILEAGEQDVVVYQELRHGDGTVAAAYRTRVLHAEARTGRSFAWNEAQCERLAELQDEAPAETAPRSIAPDGPYRSAAEATRKIAEEVGAPVIGQSLVLPEHLDVHGRMAAPWFMGQLSDAVPNLLFDWRKEVAEAAGGARMGAAVLEYRLIYRRWPKAGDLVEVRSGLGRAETKFHSLVHWALDPATGEAWMTAEAVAVTFDLDTRKVLPTPKPQIGALADIAPTGLTL